MLAAISGTNLAWLIFFWTVVASVMMAILLVLFLGLMAKYFSRDDSRVLRFVEPIPPVPGTAVPAREMTSREVFKHNTDATYHAKVAEQLAKTVSNHDLRKERIRRFVAGGAGPTARDHSSLN